MPTIHADRVRDHWYWRPGWAVGRKFYTWHLTFADQPEVAALPELFKAALEECKVVDPIPSRWLHLTMQGLGFVGEVTEDDAHRIAEAVQHRTTHLPVLDLTVGAPHIDPESVQIAVEPAEPVRTLRLAIRDAIAEVWGPSNVPEPEAPYTPHMSLGYTNADAPAEPLRQAIARTPSAPARAQIQRCELIVLHRDNRMYEWETFATATLSG